MKDFAEIFDLGPTFFKSRFPSISRADFLEDTHEIHLDFKLYETCRPTLTALAALNTDNEKEAIMAVLGFNSNIEAYILDHLDTE